MLSTIAATYILCTICSTGDATLADESVLSPNPIHRLTVESVSLPFCLAQAKPNNKAAGLPQNDNNKKQIKTEEDLWRVPQTEKEKKKQPDVPKAGQPDERADTEREGSVDDGSQLGGWGAEVERDSWGDEQRLDNRPLENAIQDNYDDDTSPDDEGLFPKRKNRKKQKKPNESGKSLTQPSNIRLGQPQQKIHTGHTRAKEVSGTLSKNTEKQSQPPDSLSPGVKIKFPHRTLTDLMQIWEQRRIHLEQRDFRLAEKDLKDYLQLSRELRIHNQFLIANVLVREAVQAHKRNEDPKASELFGQAKQLAPDLSGIYLAEAVFRFSDNPFGVAAYGSSLLGALKAAFRTPLSRNRLWVNGFIGFCLGLALVALLFALTQLLKYVRLFLHDVHHLFPKGVTFVQTGIFGVLLFLLPLIFRMGFVPVLVTWLLVAWIYQSWRERALTLVAFVFFVCSPLVVQKITPRLDLENSIANDMLMVSRANPSADTLTRLKSKLAEEDDPNLMAVLGDYYKRNGELEQALAYYSQALEKKPNSPVLLNNIGNIHFLRNQLSQALNHYHRAATLKPDSAIALFNLSRIFFQNAELDKGKQTYNQALRLDPDRVRNLREEANSQMANYVVVDIPIPVSWLLEKAGEESTSVVASQKSLLRILVGTESTTLFFVVFGLVVLSLGLLWLLRKKRFVSSECVRCGRIACRLCSPELRDNPTCGQCFHVFVEKYRVDAKSKITKEIQIRKHRRRQESVAIGLNFLFPGVGQLLKDRTLRGAFFLAVYAFLLAQLLLSEGLFRDTHFVGSDPSWLSLVPSVIIFLGCYAWAIVDGFRVDE